MAETKTEVKTYIVEYACDECNDGKLRPTGPMLAFNPPQYPHKCNLCGAEKTFTNKRYPFEVYEKVE